MSLRIPAVMIQGTGSNVGKSMLVAGLCRLFARHGLRVRPFKPQNMSNNAAAVEGGEIGRAQALQARAAMIAPHVHMNPVLLKPETDRRSQVIVQGKRHGLLDAATYRDRATLLPFVLDSFRHLSEGADLIIVEGAGSPAETNLRAGDIANMGFAHAAGVPVVLAGDIDRGGVIASLVGTSAVLDAADRSQIRGFLINKFRGDVSLFQEGVRTIEQLTGWPSLGVVPWFPSAHALPAEDALDIASSRRAGAGFKIAVPVLPRIANFDDLDPLALDPAIDLVMIPPGTPLPLDADLIILPGSKSTIADLAFLRAQGWHIDLAAHRRRGGAVLGLCGGYQMLGRTIADPHGVEGDAGTVAGLGLLAVDTVLGQDKTVRPIQARHRATGTPFAAYEIHLGLTQGEDTARAPFKVAGLDEGAASADGRVIGTYLHGLFTVDAFRTAFLQGMTPDQPFDGLRYDETVEATLDALALHLDTHLDTQAILAIARSAV
ncbi:cobyric acid synthase [Microvirga antarctica]|uniref:cobyric acid synthase n=1 Tax=Microvirga antarctica TaxID=2819233 RepID=UPI001B313C4C|nr:cobyric acid synthase [Microvirga antarctica]